jgi:FixJ family two-component response regulator
VLLDYYLPDMDGLAFLQAKQQSGLTTPVIMLTAFGQDRLPVAAMQAGALDFFAKDQVSSSLLSKAIVQAIEKARLQVQAAADAARLRELEAMVVQLQQQLNSQGG